MFEVFFRALHLVEDFLCLASWALGFRARLHMILCLANCTHAIAACVLFFCAINAVRMYAN